MKSGAITPQETASLHNIVSFKNTCAVKSNVYGGLAVDERLKKILEQDAAAAKQQLLDIRNVLKSTNALDE